MLLDVTLPTLTGIVSAIGDAMTWFFGLFGNALEIILTNPILFWVVAFGIGSSVLFAVIKVIKKFGVKGKRFR